CARSPPHYYGSSYWFAYW
nr:immunoglobulin heavy chain junction region [Mus musculus]NSM08523.1 immunoglobulin heavy chain junction region [Mus musculus]